MRVERGGLVAVRAGHADAFVAVCFRARCCSTALAAILCARARIVNSFWPKRWASSVEARLAASSPISASTASGRAWVRSSSSAGFSGGRGAEGRGGLRFRRQVFLSSHRFRSCVQRFHQLSRRPPKIVHAMIFLVVRNRECCKMKGTRDSSPRPCRLVRQRTAYESRTGSREWGPADSDHQGRDGCGASRVLRHHDQRPEPVEATIVRFDSQ